MQGIFDAIVSGNNWLNNIVWGVPMLILIVGTGIFLSFRNRFVQFGHFGYAMKNTLGKMFQKYEAGEGEITPFQAVTTALAATIGTGNIAGVTAAIVLGGPGAIFWLWVTALIGMCTKYAEVVLAVKYRERNDRGDLVGGPMYYITNGLGKNWKWLSIIFSIFGAFAAFGIGNAVQVGCITGAVNTAIGSFDNGFADKTVAIFGTTLAAPTLVNWILGIVIAIIVALTLLGGIKRLGQVAEKLVPFMSVVFIASTLIVIFSNLENLGSTFAAIFEGAFNATAFVGGTVGYAMIQCITWGVKRGVFSNEAGLGSAPIAHAASSEKDPVKQGLYGILEVFMDTIVICTLTGVTLLSSGIAIPYGEKALATTALNSAAFATVFGDQVGSLIIAIGITLFALATVLSWGLYGTRCCEYVFGSKSIKPYQILFVLVVVVGATMEISLAWDISDTLNGLMAIPNLVALIGLSGVVVKLTGDHFDKQQSIKK